MHTQTKRYQDSDFGRSQILYIKLIPIPWCDGPSITLPIPESCHNIRPGDCDTCGGQDPLIISPPINVQWTPRPLVHGVFLTWELGESYYDLPYPNISFYLKVDRFEGTTFTPDVIPRLEVVGRTNVTLQNLEQYVNYSVTIQAHDCQCGLDWSPPVFIYLNESVPLPSSPTSLSPTLVLPPPPTSHLSTPITLNSISSVTSPSHQPLTDNHAMVAGLTTLLAVVLVVITAGIAATLALVYKHMHKVSRRPPPPPLPKMPWHSNPNRCDQHLLSSIEEPILQRTRVLLLYSQETPQAQQKIILQLLVCELQRYSATKDGGRLHLEVVNYSSSTGQSSVPQWVENKVRDCDKVLCICNKEFKLEWEGKIRPLQGALVSCFKMLYLGTISRADHRKYAIVLMNVAHEELIPSDYLRECKMFLCEKDAVRDIAQFVLEIPTHCLPETQSLTPTTPTSTWESTDDGECRSLA